MDLDVIHIFFTGTLSIKNEVEVLVTFPCVGSFININLLYNYFFS